ncbi:PAS domain-containing protein [Arenibaculum pallidiluteum]|uniref:PAS domain-containing protein n=1 Tax=Arenibaculum pallidiluteum TaxID=2812559 RepID=UPI0022A7B56B|nr:PAS domain-containing protein [Arenibaculum pallidiluteum]
MDGNIKKAERYWNRIRGDMAVPRRASLDPLDIPELLSFTILVDVLSDPLDFRYRLVGTEMEFLSSVRLTGRKFSEIPHIERRGKLWGDHETVIRTRAPVVGTVMYGGPDKHVRAVCHGLFPLSTTGEVVDKIWCVGEVTRAGLHERAQGTGFFGGVSVGPAFAPRGLDRGA